MRPTDVLGCCQTYSNSSLVSRYGYPFTSTKFAPFGKRGSACQLERVSAGKRLFLVETVVNGRMDGLEVLQTSQSDCRFVLYVRHWPTKTCGAWSERQLSFLRRAYRFHSTRCRSCEGLRRVTSGMGSERSVSPNNSNDRFRQPNVGALAQADENARSSRFCSGRFRDLFAARPAASPRVRFEPVL